MQNDQSQGKVSFIVHCYNINYPRMLGVHTVAGKHSKFKIIPHSQQSINHTITGLANLRRDSNQKGYK